MMFAEFLSKVTQISSAENPMFTRRLVLTVISAPAILTSSFVFAGAEKPFTTQAFQAAQEAGQPILVEIHASWCPTCKAQKPILSELTSEPRFKDLVVLRVDFDIQKEDVRRFGAQMQSTLIVFKGANEVGRSVGDTKRESIAALVAKAI
jgi:thioredoxin 1